MDNEHRSKDDNINEAYAKWQDAMADTNDANGANDGETTSLNRQERKIISAFAQGRDGHIDTDIISAPDSNPSQDDIDKVLNGLADGSIDSHQEYELISSIAPPTHFPGGLDAINAGLDTKHERRILGFMSGGAAGFYNFEELGPRDIVNFVRQYPTPIDFDQTSEAFLQMIERNNGPERRNEYSSAMESFKNKIYGKQYEYYKCLRSLEDMALSQEYQETAMNRVNNSLETERTSEWLPGESGWGQVSRGQVSRGEIGPTAPEDTELLADNTCEDDLLIAPEKELFGVFDGVGGHVLGREASHLASRSIDRLIQSGQEVNSGEDLAGMLNYASDYIEESFRRRNMLRPPCSTGTLAKIIHRDDQVHLAYASVGDSRLYVVSKDGKVNLITEDEGYSNVISNALGLPRSGNTSRTKQYGMVPLKDGDRIVLCSDGITGDYDDELMSNQELGRIVQHAQSAKIAAADLIANARKTDDRTAIVYQPDYSFAEEEPHIDAKHLQDTPTEEPYASAKHLRKPAKAKHFRKV